jgi:hypothetical protein
VFNFCSFIIFILASGVANAHSFDERYDLPIPLEFFIVGGGLVVGLSFLLLLIGEKYWSNLRFRSAVQISIPFSRLMGIGVLLVRSISLLFSCLVLAAGFWGSGNPLLNLATNFIWINWWLGCSMAIAMLGNFWPLLNPWLSLFDLIQFILQKLGFKKGNEYAGYQYPKWLGLYLATALLLAWSWMEVVYPIAYVPARVTTIALIWTFLNLCGMFLFGKSVWQSRGDVFAVYFSMLGQFGIFAYIKQDRAICLRLPGAGIVQELAVWRGVNGFAAFIIAMLSIVLFDGLHGSQVWNIFLGLLQYLGLGWVASSSYLSGTIGLLLVWAFFAGLYYFSCSLSSRLFSLASPSILANIFAGSLIPIAVAYLIAHGFSSLIIQGQNIFFLMSDPLSLGWDLFGTAAYRPNIGIIDAGTTWYLAVSSIVIGHVIALVVSHGLTLKVAHATRAVSLVTLPQTVLMILFTMLSLIIIAEPMTTSEFSLLPDICFVQELQQ